MPFYQFRQNNSGGSFDGFVNIIIEASTPGEANEIAPEYGIYFNGVSKGIDCDCCGDRWYRVYDHDGTDVPCVYGEPVDPNDPETLIVLSPLVAFQQASP